MLLIGDLVKDGFDEYWEAQGSLARRMGISTRSAGRAARSLTKHGALTFRHWSRVSSGATVKVFEFSPEEVGIDKGEPFLPHVGGPFLSHAYVSDEQVGRSVCPGRKFLSSRSEEAVIHIGSYVPQTGTEPLTEQIQNRHKVAIDRMSNDETRRATA